MKVSELIKKLGEMPQDAQVSLTIANPKDSAYSSADIGVTNNVDGVCISAFVWSDDENAFAPWAHDSEE